MRGLKNVKTMITIIVIGCLILSLFGCSQKNDSKTYKNDCLGISIDYPKEWSVTDDSNDTMLNVTFSKEEYHFGKPNDAVIGIFGGKGEKGTVFVDDMEKSVKSKREMGKETDIKINGMDAKKIPSITDQDNSAYILLKHKDKNCVIIYQAKDKEHLKIIEDMISSIKLE